MLKLEMLQYQCHNMNDGCSSQSWYQMVTKSINLVNYLYWNSNFETRCFTEVH